MFDKYLFCVIIVLNLYLIGVVFMEEFLKLIEEYGALENRVGFLSALNKGIVDSDEIELRSKRNAKFIEINEMIIKLNERLLNDGK